LIGLLKERPAFRTDNIIYTDINFITKSKKLESHSAITAPRLVAVFDDARSKLKDWRRDYNEVRPHSAIGYKTPITLQNPATDNHPL